MVAVTRYVTGCGAAEIINAINASVREWENWLSHLRIFSR
jgi:hypothetical protein